MKTKLLIGGTREFSLMARVMVLYMLCGASASWAQEITKVYDQVSGPDWPPLTMYYSVPFVQTFTPTLSQIGFVELRVSWDAEESGSLFLNVRPESTWEILGSTEPVGFWEYAPGNGTNIATFRFSSPVQVLPGQRYAFDVEFASQPPSGTSWAAWVGATTLGHDLWFREGVVVPEPSSVVLLLLGGGVLWAARRWWLRQGRPVP